MPYPTRRYSPEEKHKAVYTAKLYNSVPKAADELGIGFRSLYTWIQEEDEHNKWLTEEDKKEIAFLRKITREQNKSASVELWNELGHESLKAAIKRVKEDPFLETSKSLQLTTMAGIATDKDLALSGETPADRKIQVNIMLPGTQDPGNRESPVELRPGERHIEIGRIEPE